MREKKKERGTLDDICFVLLSFLLVVVSLFLFFKIQLLLKKTFSSMFNYSPLNFSLAQTTTTTTTKILHQVML
jgi:hypothetical protein